MTECDYCGREVADDDYDTHLREEHADELGPIDRRRIDDEQERAFPTGPVVLLLTVGTVAVAVVYFVFFAGSGGTSAAAALPERGDDALLEGVQQFPSEGTQHVQPGTDLQYDTSPPTSGPHYSATVSAGYYTDQQSPGALVHTLEHGAVIVYYDPGAVDEQTRAELREYANEYTGTWQSVVVVPNPSEDPESAYVLTAWRHMLRLESYDSATLRAFLAEFLGRGPENPVR